MNWPLEDLEAAQAAAKQLGVSFRSWWLAAAKLAAMYPDELTKIKNAN
jgi:molybdenum-dependent DNA-binding transcriptional regulator ModE